MTCNNKVIKSVAIYIYNHLNQIVTYVNKYVNVSTI